MILYIVTRGFPNLCRGHNFDLSENLDNVMDTSEEVEPSLPGTCAPDEMTPPRSPQKLRRVISNLQRKDENSCKSTSKDTARLNVQVSVPTERKRKLKDDPDFDDTPWGRTTDFRSNWLDLIRKTQSNLLPVDAIEKSKSWFTYLPNKVGRLSR